MFRVQIVFIGLCLGSSLTHLFTQEMQLVLEMKIENKTQKAYFYVTRECTVSFTVLDLK